MYVKRQRLRVFFSVLVTAAFPASECQFWGGLFGGGNGFDSGFSPHGYGYGSGICAGARQQQQRPHYNYNQYPQYGGFNSYHEPTPVYSQPQQHVSPQPVTHSAPVVEYRNRPTAAPVGCSLPNSREADFFDQTCIFPGDHTQVGCSSKGTPLPTGTTSILTCKSPTYYSDTGAVLLEVCKEGKWYGDGKTLTCKSQVVTPAPTAAPIYQPVADYVVDYVQTARPQSVQTQPAVMEFQNASRFEEPEPQYQKPYWIPVPTTLSTTTTTTTTTTTPKPVVILRDNDWSANDSGNVKCPPLAVKSGCILECLSKSARKSNGGSGYLLTISDCSEPQLPGTEATYKCQMYYEPVSGLTTQYRKCKESGEWSGSDDGFLCQLECGKPNPVGRLPLITFGEITFLGQWPWHAALFVRDREELINACGGTLISQRAILTAAHCVNLYYSSMTRELKDVRVDLGRYYREKDDPYVQKLEVEKIVSHPAYNPWIYESDIAIIILKGSAKIGFHVRPICYPKAQNAAFDEIQLADGTYATVVGWGTDETGSSPDELRSAKLRVVGYRECIESFEDSDTGALLAKSTTFCAGNNNKTNVCTGDSGSGAYFGIKTTSGETRWYLQGLVSVGINVAQGDKRCDPEKVSIFTRISPYADWIVRVLSENDAL